MSIKSSNTANKTFISEAQQVFGNKLSTDTNAAEHFVSLTGGTADWLLIAESITEIIEAVKLATRYRIPFMVVGGGSGSLFSDVGFAGLVIVNKTSGMLLEDKSQVVVQSGSGFKELINWASSRGYGGLEDFYNLPGTVGGAIVTSAVGVKAQFIHFVRELTVLYADPNGSVSCVTMMPSALDEVKDKSRLVILSARIQLSRLGQMEILRRLRARRMPPQPLRNGRIGYWAAPRLPAGLKALKSEAAKIVLFDRLDPSILHLRARTTSQEIYDVLQALEAGWLESSGERLKIRTTLLGYWPSTDGEANK